VRICRRYRDETTASSASSRSPTTCCDGAQRQSQGRTTFTRRALAAGRHRPTISRCAVLLRWRRGRPRGDPRPPPQRRGRGHRALPAKLSPAGGARHRIARGSRRRRPQYADQVTINKGPERVARDQLKNFLTTRAGSIVRRVGMRSPGLQRVLEGLGPLSPASPTSGRELSSWLWRSDRDGGAARRDGWRLGDRPPSLRHRVARSDANRPNRPRLEGRTRSGTMQFADDVPRNVKSVEPPDFNHGVAGSSQPGSQLLQLLLRRLHG